MRVNSLSGYSQNNFVNNSSAKKTNQDNSNPAFKCWMKVHQPGDFKKVFANALFSWYWKLEEVCKAPNKKLGTNSFVSVAQKPQTGTWLYADIHPFYVGWFEMYVKKRGFKALYSSEKEAIEASKYIEPPSEPVYPMF